MRRLMKISTRGPGIWRPENTGRNLAILIRLMVYTTMHEQRGAQQPAHAGSMAPHHSYEDKVHRPLSEHECANFVQGPQGPQGPLKGLIGNILRR